MADTDRAQDFLSRQHRSITERVVALLLVPFAILYRLGILIRRALYSIGIFRSYDLPERVISIGGITVGGSGKTPVLMHIAQLLESSGKKVLILSRGYGGDSSTAVIAPDEDTADSRFSDEVRLMASCLKSTIAVGANRIDACARAKERSSFEFCLLDDGFQHWKIKRDIDIVVMDACAPFGNGMVLPRGSLREPKSALNRADAVVLTRSNQTDRTRQAISDIRNAMGDIPVIVTEYRVEDIIDFKMNEPIDQDMIHATPIMAFTAVANPGSFYRTAESAGLSIRSKRSFRDHHIFTQFDAEDLAKTARAEMCEAFVVTEKDAVKLRELDFSGIPVYAIRISLHILEGENKLNDLVFGNG